MTERSDAYQNIENIIRVSRYGTWLDAVGFLNQWQLTCVFVGIRVDPVASAVDAKQAETHDEQCIRVRRRRPVSRPQITFARSYRAHAYPLARMEQC